MPLEQSIRVAENRQVQQQQQHPRIAGRLFTQACVTWSNHELTGDGFLRVVPSTNVSRTAIECFFRNGGEEKPTPEEILLQQASLLEYKMQKADVRKEQNQKKKAAKTALDALELGQVTSSAPAVAPGKEGQQLRGESGAKHKKPMMEGKKPVHKSKQSSSSTGNQSKRRKIVESGEDESDETESSSDSESKDVDEGSEDIELNDSVDEIVVSSRANADGWISERYYYIS